MDDPTNKIVEEQGKQKSSSKKNIKSKKMTPASPPRPLITERKFQEHLSDRIHALVTNPECEKKSSI